MTTEYNDCYFNQVKLLLDVMPEVAIIYDEFVAFRERLTVEMVLRITGNWILMHCKQTRFYGIKK